MYFSLIPNISYDEKPISYPFSDSDFVTAKNFFRRYKVNQDVFDNTVIFNKYSIKDGDRPDTLAEKLYGDPFYDWVLLLVNNMVNSQYDWPLSNYEVYKLAENEYDDPYSEIHHYIIPQKIGQYAAGLRVDEAFYNAQHKVNIDGNITTKNGNEICGPVTVAEWLQEENEKKRDIYFLKPRYLLSFVDDFKKQMRYKQSGDYISSRLKKTG